MRKAAYEKIRKLGRNCKNVWFDQECAEVTEEKRKYRSKIQRQFTRAAREEYSVARRKEKRIHKKERIL
jgi:hypothetical protein